MIFESNSEYLMLAILITICWGIIIVGFMLSKRFGMSKDKKDKILQQINKLEEDVVKIIEEGVLNG